MKTIVLNGIAYTCPYIDLLLPLPAAELAELDADIAARGIEYPILVTPDRELLDGYHRGLSAITHELPPDKVPIRVVHDLPADQLQQEAGRVTDWLARVPAA